MSSTISMLRSASGKVGLMNAQLLIWETSGLHNADEFSPAADNRLTEAISALPDDTRIYIDFRNVGRFSTKTLQSVLGVAGQSWFKRITFVSEDESLMTHLTRNPEYKETGGQLFYRNHAIQIVGKLPDVAARLESSFINDALQRSFRRNPRGRMERLRSSLIYSNGVFDSGRIIRDPKQFAWCALMLSRKVREIVEGIDQSGSRAALPYPVKLVSASLRGGVFAAAVAGLSIPGTEYVAIDHLGPVHRVGERPRRITDFPTNSPIIVVADFVSGGTELKITRSYLEWHHWQMLGAVSLGVMWAPDIYSEFCGIVKPLGCLSTLLKNVTVALPGSLNPDHSTHHASNRAPN